MVLERSTRDDGGRSHRKNSRVRVRTQEPWSKSDEHRLCTRAKWEKPIGCGLDAFGQSAQSHHSGRY